MSPLPALATFVPLISAAVLGGLTSWATRRLVDLVTLAATIASLVFAITLVVATFDHRTVHWFSGWRPHHGVALGVGFVVDQLGAATVLLITVLTLASAVYSWRHLETGENHFNVLLLLFEGAMIGFACGSDLFIMFVFFELMGVAAYALTGLKIGETGPLQGAINFAVINSIGSFAMLAGIGLLYGRTGALNFAQVGVALTQHPSRGLAVVSMTLVFAGLMVKAAVVPFHFWLADAHAVAPTPVCVLFSGIMVELGVYGIARVYWAVFAGPLAAGRHGFGLVLVGAGLSSIAVGSVMCFAQQHLKRLLAFSTIAHVGILLIGVGLMTSDGLAGSAVYVAGHGTVKAALFVLVGVLLHRTGLVHEEELRGRGRGMPLVGLLFLVGGLALAGMPPFGTELGKTLIEDAGKSYAWLPWVIGFAGAVTGGAVIRATARIFLGWGPDDPAVFPAEKYAAQGEEQRETEEGFDYIPWVLIVPAIGLLAAGLAMGLVPGLSAHAGKAAAQFVDWRGYVATTFGHSAAIPPTPNLKPSLSGAWYGLAAAAAAVVLAIVTLFRHRISETVTRRTRPLLHPVRLLRLTHSGHIGDYAMWFTVGVAVFGGFFGWTLR